MNFKKNLIKRFIGEISGKSGNNVLSGTLSSVNADSSEKAREEKLAEEKDVQPKYDINDVEGIMRVIAATGKFWHDWDVLKALLSFRLKQVLAEYYASQMVSGVGSQQVLFSGETYPELVKRLDEALLTFIDGPPFTLQRLCEILLTPKSTYSSLSKLAHALEKNLLVTSTLTKSTEPYPTALTHKKDEPDKN